jgi:tetratricopeptide (TPR) repeat protein/TolB-like protein
MSSIIEGYNYDIFISYRQKDNQPTPSYGWQSKGDRWVSNFVDALKTELEATFKEDVSVYFDENPHDRLQETHNVDKSLEGKLNCLIFIPILSQTYCDPNSYAWQFEFLAFLRMAEQDRFGKDIKLRSGNVASRILPIRIHDLEPEDVKLFEKETGSVLRSLDFVFKTSTGVSRPLKANEDHPQDNLNKTFYGDQINKVGHSIKEIIQGMKTEPVPVVMEKPSHGKPLEEGKKEERTGPEEKPKKLNRIKFLSGVIIIAILIISVIFAYPKVFKKDRLDRLRSSGDRISVAVMPFQNMTNDTAWIVWQNGIQNELINNLTNSEELKIKQIESINGLIQSRGITNTASITPSVAGIISKKLNASVFIYGSIKQVGSSIRVNAQLIDSKTEEVFKSFQIDGTGDKILHITDSLSVMVRDFLIISIMEKEIIKDFRQLISTNSSEAYRYYMFGNQAFYKDDFPTANEWYRKAINIDTNFTEAIRMLAYSYIHLGNIEEPKKWCLKNYQKRDQMPEQEKLWANILYAQLFETPDEVIKYFKLLIAWDDELPVPYSNLGSYYNAMQLYDRAIPEFEKELEIYIKWGIKPRWVNSYTSLGYAYHKTRQYKKERKLYSTAEKDFPEVPILIYRQAVLALSEGKTKEANEFIDKYISIRKENSASEAAIATGLAGIYSEAGILDKGEEYYRQALTWEPVNPTRINNLAYFLIDKDRNINEGMALIDKALALSPDEYYMLDTKGWGLYKQGKYQEASEILQKSWNLRREKAIYNHEAYLHLEAAKKALASQKNN